MRLIEVGSTVEIKVIWSEDLAVGMRLLDSTYLAYGTVSEIRRVSKDGGRGGHYEYRLEGETRLLPPSRLPLRCAVGIVTKVTG